MAVDASEQCIEWQYGTALVQLHRAAAFCDRAGERPVIIGDSATSTGSSACGDGALSSGSSGSSGTSWFPFWFWNQLELAATASRSLTGALARTRRRSADSL